MKQFAISTILLGLLAGAPAALAQDASPSCGDAKGSCCEEGKACADDLLSARKDLSAWRAEYNKLSAIERDSLRAARDDLDAKDAGMQALAPTFGAQADLLAALAAIERMGAKEPTKNAQLAAEMSATYRAMARALAGKTSYPEPSLANADEIKIARRKSEADAAKAKQLWDAAHTAKLSEEDAQAIAAAQKLLKQASPLIRAIALNANTVAKAYESLDCGKGTADGDPRPAVMKTAQELQALATPYLKGVNLEKPMPMAPAPST